MVFPFSPKKYHVTLFDTVTNKNICRVSSHRLRSTAEARCWAIVQSLATPTNVGVRIIIE